MGVQLREDKWAVFSASIDLASVDTATAADQNITVPGLRPGDIVIAAAGIGASAGLTFAGGRVTAADTLILRMANNTGAPIDQDATAVVVLVFRPEKVDNACNFA